ncbi:aminopeptidase N-like [Agrilus planipennis]|uniref:Aminopeptidase n=1 Tax=Agrilus planipennis TaxID=224129 RepID=A0A1W4WN14_AGRPL|nr:aminopeptidase N-like [Agrilus planipennis]
MLWVAILVPILIILPADGQFPLPDFEKTEITERQGVGSYRLPNDVIPIKYYLTLEPEFDTFGFDGIAEINLQVINETNTITLHSVELTLQNLTINCASPAEDYSNLTIEYSFLDLARQFLVITLSRNVAPGSECTLLILYEGILNQDSHGFYRAQYTDREGNVRWLAVTQFEPTYAREAFPCFDEPALKAEFEITIIRPNNYNSLSNSPIYISMPYMNNKRMDLFRVTPRMSTYLVAFVVSEFTSVSSGYQAVHGRPEFINESRGDFALSMGLQVLPAIENFLGIAYNSSLVKLDNVAIPDDYFSNGAMENWGLVTYRESSLFSKENVSTSAEKQGIGTIISHEYGHKWFGNLVSPLWWNYVWINEGFATYLQNYGASVAQPSWRLMERFALSTLQSAFSTDQLQNARPMTYDAETPDEINALFDRIAYNKAGSVIRMVEHFLTTPVFQRGLNRFLVNNSFSAATEYELWSALDEAVIEAGINLGRPLEEIMTTWTQQAGFPLVTILVAPVTRTVTVAQERFLLDNASYDSNETWIIPLNFVISSNPNFEDTAPILLLRENSQSITTFANVNPGEWIIANIQQTGYYRVNYDEENWGLIANYLNRDNFNNIHPSNRAQLIDDALVLARAGRLNYEVVFDLISYLNRETDYVPLNSFINNLAFLDRVLSASPNIALFREFTRNLLQAAFDYLTPYESNIDDHIDRLNRQQILTTLCNLNHEACLQSASNYLRTWQHISPDLQSAVYCGGLRNGGEEEWNYLYNLYTSSTTERLQRNRILNALSCTENSTLLQRVLDMAFSQSTEWRLLSNADRLRALTGLYTNSENGIDIALNMNFAQLFASFSTRNVNTILNGLSLRLTRGDRQDLFRQILQLQDSSSWDLHGNAFRNSLSNINQTNDWIANYQDAINNWLIERVTLPTTSSPTPTTTVSTSDTTVSPTTPAPPDNGSIDVRIMPLLLLCTLILLYT